MNEFIHGPLGLIHTIFAVVALITGLIVLLKTKGTKTHKQLGYVYGVSMILLNLTAIPITNMSGGIGLFHVFIVVSLPTVILGLYFPMFLRHKKNWLMTHFSLMYWSYVGLIAAFIAEVMVRLPVLLSTTSSNSATVSAISETASSQPPNYIAIISAFAIMGIVMFVAELIFRKWRAQLAPN